MNNSSNHLLGFYYVKMLRYILRIILITGTVLFSYKVRTKITIVNTYVAEAIADHTMDLVMEAM